MVLANDTDKIVNIMHLKIKSALIIINDGGLDTVVHLHLQNN